jgi:hypothetical protein
VPVVPVAGLADAAVAPAGVAVAAAAVPVAGVGVPGVRVGLDVFAEKVSPGERGAFVGLAAPAELAAPVEEAVSAG